MLAEATVGSVTRFGGAVVGETRLMIRFITSADTHKKLEINRLIRRKKTRQGLSWRGPGVNLLGEHDYRSVREKQSFCLLPAPAVYYSRH